MSQARIRRVPKGAIQPYDRAKHPSSGGSPQIQGATGGGGCAALPRPGPLTRRCLRLPAEPAHPIDDAMPIRMPDRLDQMLSFRAMLALAVWTLTRSQMPLDTVSFTTRGNLARRSHNRAPENTRQRRRCARVRLRFASRPLAGVRAGIDSACRHALSVLAPSWSWCGQLWVTGVLQVMDHWPVFRCALSLRRDWLIRS